MFSKELIEYILHGKEETYLEYKSSMKWTKNPKKTEDKINNVAIAKAMLAMSNNPNGGVIVIGEKEKNNGEFIQIGMGKAKQNSFKYDDISRYIKNLCSPQIQFKIDRNRANINGKLKRFVIIQVTESLEFPVVATKLITHNKAEPALPENILLRENAIYIRAKSPIESREISSVQEWRELIYRILEKSKRELLKRMPCFEYIKENKRTKKTEQKRPLKIKLAKKTKVAEHGKFEKQLKRDRL